MLLEFHERVLFCYLNRFGAQPDERLDGSSLHGYNYFDRTLIDCELLTSIFLSAIQLSLPLTYILVHLHLLLNCCT